MYEYTLWKTFDTRYFVTCKSSWVIYLMECFLCTDSQYIGKSEYSIKLRLNAHINDVWRAGGLPCDKHLGNSAYKFNEHPKFTGIEKTDNASFPNQQRRSLLEHREDFWRLRLKTLFPNGLNVYSNHPQDTTSPIW